MRCRNCGWENPDNNTKCEKCNAPLTRPVSSYENTGDYSREDKFNLNATVRESDFFPDPASAPASATAGVSKDAPKDMPDTCPVCSYPLRKEATRCPNCDESLRPEPARAAAPQQNQAKAKVASRAAVCVSCNTVLTAGASFCHSCGTPAITRGVQQTVSPWDVPAGITTCSLMRLPRDNGDDEEETRIEFKGESIVLNRDNADPGNQTITSKEQAVLTFEEGCWYVEDRSQLNTTFIHAGKKTRLHPGDTLILGNRRFVFGE